MCGIFAQVGTHKVDAAERAANLFSYRGPDGTHTYTDKNISLIQHRLAVIDPRSVADQPFWNEDRSIGIVFNGEIYNFRELRQLLPTMYWRTEGDTEVLLRLYEKLGTTFLQHLDGMFAIIVYDLRTNVVLAARDTFGVKPLYYGSTNEGLICASELKGVVSALRSAGNNVRARNDVLELYLSLGYVPSPATIVEGVFMLPPGQILSYNITTKAIRFTPYASSVEVDDEKNSIEVLKESILRNTVADVPLGLFLSGGIDSTFIAHTLAEAGMHPAAFTLDIPSRPDAPYARRVAEQYGLSHEVVPLTQEAFTDAYLTIRNRIDTPTADSSLIPTLVLSRAARKNVTVVLSGEGGDEVFLGYDRHNALAKLTSSVRTPAAFSVAANLPMRVRRALAYGMRDAAAYYALTAGIAPTPKGVRAFGALASEAGVPPIDFDLRFYLENDLLRKIDLATMYASLEGRVPFCSEAVLRAARKNRGKLLAGGTKSILKQHLAQQLPHDLIYRPKSGFSAPFPHFSESSEAIQHDLQLLPEFAATRLGSLSNHALEAAARNHYAQYGLLSLMHAYQNLDI